MSNVVSVTAMTATARRQWRSSGVGVVGLGELSGDEADEVSARPVTLGGGEHRVDVVEVLADVQR